MRLYAKYLPLAQKDRIRDIMALFYYQARYRITCGDTSGKDHEYPEKVCSCSHATMCSFCNFRDISLPSPEEMDVELQQFASWVPASLLEVRQCSGDQDSSTLFAYHYYGRTIYEPNERFAELFASVEEMEQLDTTMFRSKIVAPFDGSQFFLTALQGVLLQTAGDDQLSDTTQDTGGIYSLKLKTGNFQLFQVWRYCWLGKTAARGSFFLSLKPLPLSRYLSSSNALLIQKNVSNKRSKSSWPLNSNKEPQFAQTVHQAPRASNSVPKAPTLKQKTVPPMAVAPEDPGTAFSPRTPGMLQLLAQLAGAAQSVNSIDFPKTEPTSTAECKVTEMAWGETALPLVAQVAAQSVSSIGFDCAPKTEPASTAAVSLVQQVARIKEMLGIEAATLPEAVQRANEIMGFTGSGALPAQVNALAAALGLVQEDPTDCRQNQSKRKLGEFQSSEELSAELAQTERQLKATQEQLSLAQQQATGLPTTKGYPEDAVAVDLTAGTRNMLGTVAQMAAARNFDLMQ